MKGYIHSFESFGTVDGPGVRYVVFFQGCPMRCMYCHNPDTWNMQDGRQIEAENIIENITRNRAFYTTGGITATGGEPLMQLPFLTELFMKAKEQGISTCLDTSGILFSEENKDAFDALMEVTDLVLLDIKHMDSVEHEKLTGKNSSPVFAFARYLNQKKIPVWIRHVVVPGITDQKEELMALGTFLATLDNVEKLEVLPYHSMGKVKYENLQIPYRLMDTPQLSKAEAELAEQTIRNAWKQV